MEGEVTNQELADRMDLLGQQMNWLCENLQSLFSFVNQLGANGGGIRSVVHALRQGPPELKAEIGEPEKAGA
jgi:hypothetical protein